MRIWYLTPYALDRNIGREYNEQISLLPNGDWICIRDGDTCFTTPDSLWGKQIADIATNNQDYDLIGCMTNRLVSTEQCHGGIFSDNGDWDHHKSIGKELFETKYDSVKAAKGVIAGMFMLFNKNVWDKVKFKENVPYYTFDGDWSIRLKRDGFKLGIAEGLYLFHDYRWGKPNPKNNIDHLK